MKKLFLAVVLVFFFIISCNGGKLSRPDANTDDDNTTDKDVVVTDDDGVTDNTTLPDESQDETADETQDTPRPDETTDETTDEIVDEMADEVPDVDTCDNQCTLGAKQCDPSNLDDSQVCMKDSYGCSRWIFSETCNDTPYPSSYICEAGNCKPDCDDECMEGIVSCDGDNLMNCIMGMTGCTVEVLDTNCANGGQECETLIGGAHCVNPEVEVDFATSGSTTPRDASHTMKANVIWVTTNMRLTRFSQSLKPTQDQNFTFFVYRWDDGNNNWQRIYASAPLAVTAVASAQYYESPPIDITLSGSNDYAIGVFFDKDVDYVYQNGDIGDFGPGEHWSIFSKDDLSPDVHTLPATADADMYDPYTYIMKLYYR